MTWIGDQYRHVRSCRFCQGFVCGWVCGMVYAAVMTMWVLSS